MYRRAILTWTVLAAIGVLNGILRGTTYGRFFSDRTAHQISTTTCVAGLFTGGYLMTRRMASSTSDRALLGIGAGWSLATVAFEFGFGRFVAGESWRALLDAYDIRTGQTWIAVPLSILAIPILTKRLARRSTGSSPAH